MALYVCSDSGQGICRKSILKGRETRMRHPSIKTLTRAFGPEKAKAIRAIMAGPLETEQGNRMERIDIVLGTHGVEYIERGSNERSPAFYYCNTGDTYNVTVLRFPLTGLFRVGCWGDIVERGNYQ